MEKTIENHSKSGYHRRENNFLAEMERLQEVKKGYKDEIETGCITD